MFGSKKKFKYSDVEPQDVLLDSLANRSQDLEDRRLESPLSRQVFFRLWFIVIVLFSIVGFRIFSLQVTYHDQYMVRAENNRYQYLNILATRGVLYDRHGTALVENKPEYSVYFSPAKHNPDNLDHLTEIIGMDIKEVIEDKEEEFLLSKNIDNNQLVALEVNSDRFPEIRIEKSFVRIYEEGLSHILGYTSMVREEEVNEEYYSLSQIGRSGLEKEYEDILKVIPGQIKVERDVNNKPLSSDIAKLPEPGQDIYLNIDLGLQRKAREALINTVERVGASGGSVVALDPNTGGVLALVSYPDYDNNAFSLGEGTEEIITNPDEPLFNRVVSGVYPIGSNIKPFLSVAALEEKIISPDKEIYSSGQIVIPNPWNPSQPTIFRDNKAHGWTDMKRAIAVSSNVYFYAIGGGYEDQEGLGALRIKEYLEKFGLGQLTGIDLPGESKGQVIGPEEKETWRIGDTYNLSIGQGYLLATPLQVATSFIPIANGGKWLVPSVVKKDAVVVKENIFNKQNIEVVRQGMRQTVLEGTALSLGHMSVAAKTGTAQIPRQEHFHNWITAFAPYDNPTIVLTVLIEEVSGIQPATIPTAREILEWYLNEENN